MASDAQDEVAMLREMAAKAREDAARLAKVRIINTTYYFFCHVDVNFFCRVTNRSMALYFDIQFTTYDDFCLFDIK